MFVQYVIQSCICLCSMSSRVAYVCAVCHPELHMFVQHVIQSCICLFSMSSRVAYVCAVCHPELHMFVQHVIQSCICLCSMSSRVAYVCAACHPELQMFFFVQCHCYMTALCLSTKREALGPTWRPGSCGIDNADYIKSDGRNNKPLLDKPRYEHKTFSMEFQQLSNT